MSTATSTNACKLLLLGRCIRAVLLSVAIQFILLTVFLLFVNFQLLQPLSWLASTLRLACSFYTWFGSIPLICAVVLYGVTLCQQHLAERHYRATRYRWLLHNGPRKLFFLGAHLLVGYLTAWLYTGYLHTDYRHLIYKCYGQDCLSSHHVFLLGMGAAAGFYYFIVEHLRHEVSIEFGIVEQSRSDKLRALLYATLLKALISAALPALCYTFAFWLIGPLVKHRLSHFLGVDADDRLVGFFELASNLRLLFYAWLLTAQILSNMHLMRRFYATLLAEHLPLVIARPRVAFAQEQQQVTLVAALGVFNVYVVQCLAAHFFYQLSQRQNSSMRLEIFQLTEPGNRPANWRAICDQCLSIVGSFTDELSDSMRSISLMPGPGYAQSPVSNVNAKQMAEKLLLRQYNQMHGIRKIVSPLRELHKPQQQVKPLAPNWCKRVSGQLEAGCHRLLQRIPGLVFLFGEAEGAKTAFLLDNAQPVVWLTQALAQICVASLQEDRYGVLQSDLPAIIKALHRLKCELDKLSNVMANARTSSASFNLLRCAVRRSLYNICTSFYDYLSELVPAGEELRQLQSFIHQE